MDHYAVNKNENIIILKNYILLIIKLNNVTKLYMRAHNYTIFIQNAYKKVETKTEKVTAVISKWGDFYWFLFPSFFLYFYFS